MVVVSITRLRVRHWRYLPAFYIQAFRSALQAKAAAGGMAPGASRQMSPSTKCSPPNAAR